MTGGEGVATGKTGGCLWSVMASWQERPELSLPRHPLSRVALAEQEASGKPVNINWKGLGQKESRFPGAHGLHHETGRSHVVRHSLRRKKSLIKRLWCTALPASALVCFCFLVCVFSLCVWRKVGAPVCLRMFNSA